MSLRVLELPGAPADVASWLDRELVGLDLGRLVSELSAVHAKKAATPPPSLEEALGDRLPNVVKSGLRNATRGGLSTVMRNPMLLLELQDRILVDGGTYWDGLTRDDPEVNRLALASLPDIAGRLVAGSPQAGPVPRSSIGRQAAPERVPAPPRPPRVGLIRFWARAATVVAAMFGFIYGLEHEKDIRRFFNQFEWARSAAAKIKLDLDPSPFWDELPPSPVVIGEAPWGLNRASLYERTEPAPDYLDRLAEACGEWYDQVPISAESLIARLGSFRTGIGRLRIAEHSSLTPESKDWLKEQAAGWAGVFDAAVEAVEQGRAVDEVRKTVDEAVGLIVRTLQDRADSGKN